VEITIGKQELIQTLSIVQGILDKAGDSILSHIKLEAFENEVRFTASSNQNIWITTSVTEGLEVKETGSICVKGHRLFSIAKALQYPSVVLKLETNSENNIPQFSVLNGKASFKISECKSADEYPPLNTFNAFTNISLENASLKRMIDETGFSIAEKERSGLNGVRLERIVEDDGNYFRMVSSDGTRLSLSQAKYEGELDPDIDEVFEVTLFPQKALLEIKKLCEIGDDDSGAGEDNWKLHFGERESQFQKGHTKITVAMIAGQFPGYHELVEGMAIPNKASINRKDLLDICRRAAIFITKSKTSIRVDLQEELLTISIKNPDVGSFSESISQDYFGNEYSFFFNFLFLQDVLRAVSTECIEMNFGHSKNSAVLMTVPDRSDCKFVIMPMKMQ